ncbi:uncharacterized protein LOC111371900 [Olea europaea var. sylvestris]|uniref:Uncharacterized protein LOC111371900 n=1 Tax=Olea europaea subsp. europaea TaxID=158383 RepID=A0A8S0R1Q8_OLEEU|nr:uncharacterized protein LOC111371900 [Olea europaea var. sylvestris]CAA2972046.1 uncharacterized protein LOC111371900 [Olea europaea subsp. europaea]
MDWFSWLSKTGLEPSLVYEYGLAFSHNELEEEDIAYFNHEFLQSMGISIAKHRLEILKLARREKSNIPHSMSMLFIAIKRTRKCFSKYFRAWNRNEDSSLVLVPRCSDNAGWKNAMVKRNKRLMATKQSRGTPLFLTNGSPMLMHSSRINSFLNPINMTVHDLRNDDKKMLHQDHEEYWSSAVEEMRWDTMFHSLKPT